MISRLENSCFLRVAAWPGPGTRPGSVAYPALRPLFSKAGKIYNLVFFEIKLRKFQELVLIRVGQRAGRDHARVAFFVIFRTEFKGKDVSFGLSCTKTKFSVHIDDDILNVSIDDIKE